MEKIVFYIETSSPLVGKQLAFLDMASNLSLTKANVYYINNYFESDASRVEDSGLTYIDIKECDFSQFENSILFTPINYLMYMLNRFKNIKNAKVCVYVYSAKATAWLFSQLQLPDEHPNFIKMFSRTKSYAFIDKASVWSCINDWENHTILPLCLNGKIRDFEDLGNVDESSLNFGFLGAINDNISVAIRNLSDAIIKLKLKKRVNIHIIGGNIPKLWETIDISIYSPYIRFVCTGHLNQKKRTIYIQKNVDCLFAFESVAVEASQLSVPTLIPIIGETDLGYQYIYDTIGFDFKLDKSNQNLLKTVTAEQIINDIYVEKNKKSLAENCYLFCKTYCSENIAASMMNFFNKSFLSLKKCLENSAINCFFNDFSTFNLKNPNVSFSDYILYRKNNNNKKYLSAILKNKETTKKKFGFKAVFLSLIPSCIKNKRFYKIQFSYKKKIKDIRRNCKENNKIKVAFILVFKSVFPVKPVFEKMLNETAFDPYIIIAPNVHQSFRFQMDTLNDAFGSLSADYPGRVISGYDKINDSYLELHSEYNLIFFCNPYKHLVHSNHHIEYFLDKNVLPIYSSYGFAALKFWDEVIATDFYNYLWKACVETESNLDYLRKTEKIKGKNGLVTGYIKMDGFSDVQPNVHTRKRILICPHHTVWGWKTLNISNFLNYADLFLELPKIFPEIDFIFRPHPLLFSNLKQHKIWTQQKIEEYLEHLNSLPNITYDNSGDYMQQFADSDAMIHDCGSFIGEYLYTMKPCCYMLKSIDAVESQLVPLGQECMSNYYHAYNAEDIIRFIQDVVINKNDTMQASRENFVKKELMVNYPFASNFILDEIKRALKLVP